MTDAHYSHPKLVALYDTLNAWDDSRDFYLSLPRAAPERVLDAGCGTGMLATAFAAAGHRVAGIDPAAAMLAFAMRREGSDRVDWHSATLQAFRSEQRFDLIYMTGHAFQCLLRDEDVLAAFRSVAGLLAPAGRFVFDTRNPAAQAWRRWQPDVSRRTGRTPAGETYEMFHRLLEVDGPFVTFETSYRIGAGAPPLLSRSTLRFHEAAEIAERAGPAGLCLGELWGDWDRSALSGASPEIIVSLQAE